MFGATQARLKSQVFGELTAMVGAGVSIGESLSAVAEDMEHGRMASVLDEMGMQVSSGSSLADAMRRHPKVFRPVSISMIEVGEEGGRLENALRGAADYHERDFELRHLLTRETFYPIVLFAAIIFIWPMANFVRIWITDSLLPALLGLLVTLLLMIVSIGIPLGALVFALWAYSRTEQGRGTLDRIRLSIPIIGNLIGKLSLARFCRALASLYSSGVLMGSSLRLAAEASGNLAIERELAAGIAKVEGGGKLSEALAESPLIPRMVVRMLRTGEDTGDLDQMAHRVADHFEEEAQTAIKQMAVSITPIAVLIAGAIVLLMALSFYTGAYPRLLGFE